MADTTVNVTLVTREQRSRLRACLESVLLQDHPVSVTVVDNRSSDELRADLKAMHRAGIVNRLFLLDRDMGMACAANLGWDAGDAPFSLLMDCSAAFAAPDAIARMVRLAAHNPELATVSLRPTRPAHRMVVLDAGYVAARPLDGLCGSAAVLTTRRARARLGHWCEDYRFPGDEAVDFSFRAAKAGLACVCLPSRDGRTMDHEAAHALPAEIPPEQRTPDPAPHARLHANLELYRLGLSPVYLERKHHPRQRRTEEWELVLPPRKDAEDKSEPMLRLLHRQRSLAGEHAPEPGALIRSRTW